MADSTPKLSAQLPMSSHDLAKHLLSAINTVATMVNDMNVRLARMEERQSKVADIGEDHSALEERVGKIENERLPKIEIAQAKTGTTVAIYAAAVAGVSAIVVSGVIGLAFVALHH